MHLVPGRALVLGVERRLAHAGFPDDVVGVGRRHGNGAERHAPRIGRTGARRRRQGGELGPRFAAVAAVAGRDRIAVVGAAADAGVGRIGHDEGRVGRAPVHLLDGNQDAVNRAEIGVVGVEIVLDAQAEIPAAEQRALALRSDDVVGHQLFDAARLRGIDDRCRRGRDVGIEDAHAGRQPHAVGLDRVEIDVAGGEIADIGGRQPGRIVGPGRRAVRKRRPGRTAIGRAVHVAAVIDRIDRAVGRIDTDGDVRAAQA